MFSIFGKNWSEARRRPDSEILYTKINFFLFQIKLSSAIGRCHDVGELAVKMFSIFGKNWTDAYRRPDGGYRLFFFAI